MVWLSSPFTLTSAALLVVISEVANGLKLHDGPRSPFLPEGIVEVELEHSGRRLQVDDVSFNTTDSCGLCRGLDGAIVLEDAFPLYQSDNTATIPNGLSCKEMNLLSSGLNATSSECFGFQIVFRALCCAQANTTIPSYQSEQNVQAALIGPGSGYNANIAPIPQGEFTLDIPVSFEYYHISELNVKESTAEIFVGISMRWVDERLRWDPAEFGGVFNTAVRGSPDVEKTQIWVPDYDLLNRVKGVSTLVDTLATVYADGTVSWFRLGGLKVLCAFTGLERFPYDTIGCYLDFASFDRRLRYKLGLFGDETDVDDSIVISESFQVKYQEYSVVEELASAEIIYGTQLRYHLYFKRAHQYYDRVIIIPTILFTLLSFGMFLLDLRVGERLAFGVSLLLVIIAQGILTAGMLPVCGERLWIDQLTSTSMFWVVGALAESILVAHFFFMETRDSERILHLGYNKQALERSPIRRKGVDDQQSQSVGWVGEEEQGSIRRDGVAGEQSQSLGAIDETDAEESEHLPPRRGLERRAALSKLNESVFQKQNESWRRRVIINLDKGCLIVFPVTYIIFVVVMYARNDKWG